MKIGTLVMHESDMHKGMGIVIDNTSRNAVLGFSTDTKYSMVTVQWLDGMGVGLYWTDELEVICS